MTTQKLCTLTDTIRDLEIIISGECGKRSLHQVNSGAALLGDIQLKKVDRQIERIAEAMYRLEILTMNLWFTRISNQNRELAVY